MEERSIQLTLFNEDNAITFRGDSWGNPLKMTTNKDKIKIVTNHILFIIIWLITIIGINFWIVDRIKIIFQEEEVKILKNHKWNGARPNFNNIVIKIKKLKICPFEKINNLNRNHKEPILCTK